MKSSMEPIPVVAELSSPINSADLYRTLLDNMTEGVSLSDEAGVIVYTNPAEDFMFGYEPGELVGQHVSVQNAYAPDENARIVGEVIAELKRSGQWRGDWLNRRRDGSVFITTSRISAVEVDGRPHWLCVQEDATAEKQAISALRDGEARLEIATSTAKIGIWDWDVTTGRMTYSPLAKAVSGFAPGAEVTYDAVRAIVHPDDLPLTSAQAARALDPDVRDRTPYEYRIVQPDGDVRWVLAHGEAVFADIEGVVRAVRYIGTLQDVTERRQLEEAERASARRLRLAIDAGRMAVWEVDLVTDTIIGSPELNRLLGFAHDAVPTAEEVRERYFPGERERLRAIGREAIARGERFMEAEHRYLWPDGSVRCLLLRCEILFSGDIPVRAVGVVTDITESKRVEDALRTSEARLALAQEAAGAGVWDWDVSTGALIWSPEVYPLYGINPSHGGDLYAAWQTALHPNDRNVADAIAQRAAREGTPFSMDYRVVHPGGNLRWVRSQGTAVLGPDGKPTRVVGINLDVTEQHEAEARLRAEAEQLERAVEERTRERDRIWNLSPDLMCVAGTDGTLLSVNPAWERLLGWPLDWLAGRKAAELKHADDAERTATELASLAAGRPTVNFEDRYRHRDGSWRWVSWSIEPAGELLYCAGRDITLEKKRLAELAAADVARREADALYRAYFENTAEALFVVNVLEDGGFTVEDLNPAHQASIGLLLTEVQGKRIDEIMPPDLAAAVVSHYRQAIASNGVHQYRDTFELNGQTTYWDTVLVPVRDQSDRIVRLIGSSRDLTPQIAAEDQLRQSQKMEAMGQLTGGVAHDFNNLLTPIIGSLDLLMRRGLGNEREQRMISGAMQSAERAKTLVQRLLAFARRQPLQAAAVDLSQLVNGMAGLIGSTLGPKVDIRVELGEDLPLARADANQLEMALLNLAVNARDAMPEGGLLTIAAERESLRHGHHSKLIPGQYVRLSVADTGAGMDAHTLERAIEPFFSTKGIGKGTGLGLSMVHGLAAQLGGALTISSELNRGTIVELWLPISNDPLVESDASVPAKLARGLGQALLVDDEDLVRISTADMLEDIGYEVVEATSAEDALRLLNDGLMPNLLVTDHLMPGMSGVELARAAHLLNADLPVLIVSGYAELDGIAPDLPRLTKPFRNAELAKMLANLRPR